MPTLPPSPMEAPALTFYWVPACTRQEWVAPTGTSPRTIVRPPDPAVEIDTEDPSVGENPASPAIFIGDGPDMDPRANRGP